MDLANGTVTPIAMQRLYEQLRGITDKEYGQAITTILSTQLQLDSPIQRYELLFQGTYVEARLETFWAVHSQFLIETIAGASGKGIAAKFGFRGKGDAGRAKAKAEWLISLLQFWFVDAVFAFKELGFPAQEFFFFLPTVLGELKRTSDWPDIVSHLDRLSQDRPWRYSLLLQLGLSPSGTRIGSTKR